MRSETGSLRADQSYPSRAAHFTRETERELAQQWIAGNEKAGRRLIEGCLPFVLSIALEYRHWGVPLEDIIQQGNVGLLLAARRFDPQRECRLATYAAYWVRAEIRQYVVRAYRIVRLGTTKGERRALRAYRMTGESDPSTLAHVSGLSVQRAEQLIPLLAAREVSLDATFGDAAPGVERLSSPDPSPEAVSSASESHAQAKTAISRALRHLSVRERMIIRERMMAEDPTTLEQLGVKLGVSKERVRQIEASLRRELKSSLAMFEGAGLG